MALHFTIKHGCVRILMMRSRDYKANSTLCYALGQDCDVWPQRSFKRLRLERRLRLMAVARSQLSVSTSVLGVRLGDLGEDSDLWKLHSHSFQKAAPSVRASGLRLCYMWRSTTWKEVAESCLGLGHTCHHCKGTLATWFDRTVPSSDPCWTMAKTFISLWVQFSRPQMLNWDRWDATNRPRRLIKQHLLDDPSCTSFP